MKAAVECGCGCGCGEMLGGGEPVDCDQPDPASMLHKGRGLRMTALGFGWLVSFGIGRGRGMNAEGGLQKHVTNEMKLVIAELCSTPQDGSMDGYV